MIKMIAQPDFSVSMVRKNTSAKDVAAAVREIIARVIREGDSALFNYAREFDDAELTSLEVTRAEMKAAFDKTDKRLIASLEAAANNIKEFHEKQLYSGFETKKEGRVLGQRVLPLGRVGIYVPGGTAAYPSTVLMNCIPAKLAGVGEIVMVSPPGKNGKINGGILAAAYLCGADRVFTVGGAQAVAALCYGTESIPKVDKIVGPGNAYVAEAKRQVFGDVAIDTVAGPSEVLIIADETARAEFIAADMLAQAEHDVMAASILLTPSGKLAAAVAAEIESQLEKLPRKEIAKRSIDENGLIVLTGSMLEAVDTANEIAPEHLEICAENPMSLLEKIRNAGSVFLGDYSPEALGDYMAGPNHTLPTGGRARFASPLSVEDFLKRSTYVFYDKSALKAACGDIITIAEAEGLSAHANSVKIRFGEEE